jgi:hypothetical protein
MHFAADWGSYQYLRFTSALGPIAATALLRQPHVIEKRCYVLGTGLVASDISAHARNAMIDKGI